MVNVYYLYKENEESVIEATKLASEVLKHIGC